MAAKRNKTLAKGFATGPVTAARQPRRAAIGIHSWGQQPSSNLVSACMQVVGRHYARWAGN